MTRIVLDTNVLVSFLSDRNAAQQEQAAGLFTAAAAGEHELILHQVVVVELAFVLRNLYGLPASDLARLLDDLLALPAITPVNEVSWSHVLTLWPTKFPDFADGVLASVLQQGRFDVVATFDVRFRKRLRREGLGVHG